MGDITYEKNMKQFLCILTTCLLLAVTCIPAFAQDSMQHIQYYDDGSYTIETLTIDNPSISLYSSTKKGTRSKIYYSSDNIKQWSVTVTGTFSYGNGSSTCTAASATANSNVSAWVISSNSSSKSGNSATATATAIQYLRGHEVQRKTLSTTVSCSSTGTLY